VRQQRGPLESHGDPVEIDIQVRRYRCQACGAVILVVPRGVIARRVYSGRAIGLALALFGSVGNTMADTFQSQGHSVMTTAKRMEEWRWTS